MILISPPSKYDAIFSLVGGTKGFSVTKEGEFTWGGDTDEGKPTEEEISAELSKLNLQWSAEEYSRNRRREYPSIQDLVVALYDTDDKSAIEAKRAEIKLKYPKPE